MDGLHAPKRARFSEIANTVRHRSNIYSISTMNKMHTSFSIQNEPTRRKTRFQKASFVPKKTNFTIKTECSPVHVQQVLNENVLGKILGYSCLDSNDLLNFRLVNHSWRKAATNILLERNSHEIQLTIREVPLPSSHDPNGKFQIYCNAQRPNIPLSELTDLISKNPHFPSRSLRFYNESAFGNDNPSIELKELERFFTLYGHKLKSVCVGNKISIKDLRDLLLKKTPYLEYLDVNSLKQYRSSWKSMKRHLTIPQGAPILSSLKSIRLGSSLVYNCYDPNSWEKKTRLYTPEASEIEGRANLCSLILAANNVKEFQEVSIENLACLVELGKGHLVKSLDFYSPRYYTAGLFTEFIHLKPKLCSLKVNLDYCSSRLITPLPNKVQNVSAILSNLIESSQDSLQELDLHVNPFNFPRYIEIPPLKNLKCIKFAESRQMFNVSNKDSKNIGDIFVFVEPTEDCSQRSHFPQLEKILLDINHYNVEDQLMGFFYYGSKSKSEIIDSNNCNYLYSLPCVNHLEINNSKWPNDDEISMLRNLLPCLKSLRINCEQAKDLHRLIWKLCPNVEKVKTFGMKN